MGRRGARRLGHEQLRHEQLGPGNVSGKHRYLVCRLKKEGKTPKIDELSPFLSTCRTKIVISGDIP